MQMMMHLVGALVVGAGVLAFYERGKKLRIDRDAADGSHRDPARAAFTETERIRAEGHFSNPPLAGGFF